MFTVIKNPTFRTVATINVPTDEGVVAQTLSVRFRVGADEDDVAESYGQPFLRGVILTLDELVDETGAPLAYTDELRDQLLARPFVRMGLLRAYFDALAGVKAATRGN